MPRPQTPQVKIGGQVAIALDDGAYSSFHAPVGIHVEQDSSSVADESDRPTRGDTSADYTGDWVHPEPAKGAREQQAANNKNRYGGVGDNVNERGAHVVVARGRLVGMFVLFEDDRIRTFSDLHIRREFVRLGNLRDRLQIVAVVSHDERLPCAIEANGFDPVMFRH